MLVAATAQAGPKTAKVTDGHVFRVVVGRGRGRPAPAGDQRLRDSRTPSINVDYSVINGDYTTAMTARFAAHNPPDVFYVDSSVASGWAQQGVLAAAQQLHQVDASTTRRRSIPSLLERVQGRREDVYGFPKDWSPLAMEINNRVLAQAQAARRRRPGRSSSPPRRRWRAEHVVNGGKPICLSPDWARMLPFIFQNKAARSRTSRRRPTPRRSTSTSA